MKRDDCINIVNKLLEWKLITEIQAEKIIKKRDKLYKEVSAEVSR